MERARRFKSGVIVKCALLVICEVLSATGALGQTGASGTRAVPCMVNYIRLRIATADDDLRGWNGRSSSKDNLDVTVFFDDNSSQLARDVNEDKSWPNNSVNVVEIKLKSAMPLNDIRAIKLQHTGSGFGVSPEAAVPVPGIGIEMPDTWKMAWLEAMAEGTDASALIARYGANQFTEHDRALNVRTQIPSNSCEVGERFGRLNSGMGTLQPVNGTGSKYTTQKFASSTIQAGPHGGSEAFHNNRLIQQAIAHTVQIGPKASGSESDGSYTKIIAVMKRQSAIAHSLLLPAVRPVSNNSSGPLLSGGTTQMLNPQPYPPKGSTPQIAAGQTMSASGVQTSTDSSSATVSNKQSGPSPHRPPNSQRLEIIGAAAPVPTQLCKAGIATVDGGSSGIWFSPVPGEDGRFLIQGCGFGAAVGQVYLSGVQLDPALARGIVQRVGSSSSPDHVSFQVTANDWSNRQIIAQIDANATGFYDTSNVTLNVTTASGQTYRATGMNFLAAREDRLLSWIVPPPPGHSSSIEQTAFVSSPTADVHLSIVTDSGGDQLVPGFESPSASTTWSNQTVDVIRAKLGESTPSKVTFAGGTDTYQLNLASGFQLAPQTGVKMRHTQIDVDQCRRSFHGDYGSNGNWGITYTSDKSFQVSWQEQACWPRAGATGASSLDYGSVSAYALQITVVGPRGLSPWASGHGNPPVVRQPDQHPLLLAH